MKYAYTYFFVCLVLPFFWDSPAEAIIHERQKDFGPDPDEYPYRCDCYAVEPDMECSLWAWENCEVHPVRDEKP